MPAQLGAEAVQMVLWGFPISRLSRAPRRTTRKPGSAIASLNSGVPQVGQKRLRIRFPAFEGLVYSASLPETVSASLRKKTLSDALPEHRYWQSRHQQALVAKGGCDNEKRTAPQRHRPLMAISIDLPPILRTHAQRRLLTPLHKV